MPDAITAISLVALGTSLPSAQRVGALGSIDRFARLRAAATKWVWVKTQIVLPVNIRLDPTTKIGSRKWGVKMVLGVNIPIPTKID